MMILSRLLCLVLALVLAPIALIAQGGSNYSALGLGDARPTVGAIYDGMAGTTLAMPTPYGINVVNPALVGMATTTRIQMGYRFNQHIIANPDGRSQAQNNGEIDGLLAMFSVDTSHGFGFTFGILPFTTVAYTTQRELEVTIDDDVFRGTSNQTGSGGSSMLHFSASFRPMRSLYIGAEVNGLFGVIDYTDEVRVNGPFNRVTSTQSYDIRGLLVKGGVFWQASPWLNVGAFVSAGPESSVFITRRAIGIGATGENYDTIQINESASGMPMQYGIGISTPLGKGLLGADIEFGDYSGVTINDRPDAGYTTGIRTSLGYNVSGSPSSNVSWANRLGYRFGASYNVLPVTYLNQNINEVFGSAGLSFPLGGQAMVDVAAQFGARTPVADNSISELVGRLTVTVSIGETWFKPFSRE